MHVGYHHHLFCRW